MFGERMKNAKTPSISRQFYSIFAIMSDRQKISKNDARLYCLYPKARENHAVSNSENPPTPSCKANEWHNFQYSRFYDVWSKISDPQKLSRN